MSMTSKSFSSVLFLQKLKKKGRVYELFDENIAALQEIATNDGFDDDTLKLIVQVIKKSNLGAQKQIKLIQCLIPIHFVQKNIIQSIILWCIKNVNNMPITVFNYIIIWLNGILNYELTNKSFISLFYDAFFSMLMKFADISHLSLLIYSLTTPQHVNRRQVLRILKLQSQFRKNTKDWRKLNSILLLFKTYKPECVPENISATNTHFAWKELPEVLKTRFEAAKTIRYNHRQDSFNNIQNKTEIFRNNKVETLIPPIQYIPQVSKLNKRIETVSIFQLNSIKDLGKHFNNIEMPCQAMSLLTNSTGYHILAFTDVSYQITFMHNLYLTLRKAFFLEENKYKDKERTLLLKKISSFCEHIQEGIPTVNHFLQQYLSRRNGDNSEELLDLLSWSFDAPKEIQDNLMKNVKLMFQECSIEEKCKIIKMLGKLIYNKYINKSVNLDMGIRTTLFLKLTESDDIIRILIIIGTAEELAISGLLNHYFDLKLLSEVLLFYEQLAIIQSLSRVGIWTIAPPTVVYSSFTSSSSSILSRLCELLTRYYTALSSIQTKGFQNEYKNEISLLNFYIRDFTDILLKNKAFDCKRNNRLFLKTFPKTIIEEFPALFHGDLLNITNHLAFLPTCIFALSKVLTPYQNIQAGVLIARQYYPAVSDFINIILETRTNK